MLTQKVLAMVVDVRPLDGAHDIGADPVCAGPFPASQAGEKDVGARPSILASAPRCNQASRDEEGSPRRKRWAHLFEVDGDV